MPEKDKNIQEKLSIACHFCITRMSYRKKNTDNMTMDSYDEIEMCKLVRTDLLSFIKIYLL